MSPLDSEVDAGVLDGIASTLRRTSMDVDAVGNSVPATPDGGDGTPAILGIMARLVDNAGQLVIGAAAAAEAVEKGKVAYQENETETVTKLHNAGGTG